MFDVYIDGIKINQYIDYGSLEEYEQISKGDGAWDYRVDSIDFDSDTSILNVLGVDEFHVGDIKKKSAEVYYYDNKILGGVVGQALFDFDTQTVEIELYSIARIVSDITISDIRELITTYTFNFWSNEVTLQVAIERLSYFINIYLAANYPFSIDSWNNVYDVIDFPFLRSLVLNAITIPNYTVVAGNLTFTTQNKHIRGIYRRTQAGVNLGVYPFVLAWEVAPYGYIYANLNNNGLSNPVFKNPIDFVSLYGNSPVNMFNDTGILNYVAASHFDDSPVWVGKAIIGGNYFTCMRQDSNPDYNVYYLDRVIVTDEDIFTFSYTEGTIGDILKGFAQMTNSIVTIDSGGRIIFAHRGGLNPGWSPIRVDSAKYDISDYKDEQFEIPEEFYILDEVRAEMNNYYSDYFSGKKINWEFEVQISFQASHYPLMLKTFPAIIKGNIVDAGPIINIEYGESFLTIKTEKNLG